MLLVIYYLGLVVVGDMLAYLVGFLVERQFGSNPSLIVFLALYFGVLWGSWVLSVWLTEPKKAPALSV